MGFTGTVRRRCGACVCGASLLVSGRWVEGASGGLRVAVRVSPAGARTGTAGQRRGAEVSAWERAERARDAFEAEPEGSRTRLEYTRVMDGFRAIYHDAPQDVHAAEAVNAVAELLTEQGRGQRDAKLLKAAVGQYEFLRTQYPGSSLRVGALLAEGQIEQNELHDEAGARERYRLLLKLHPRSALAEEARAGLASLDAARVGSGDGVRMGERSLGAGIETRGTAGEGTGNREQGTTAGGGLGTGDKGQGAGGRRDGGQVVRGVVGAGVANPSPAQRSREDGVSRSVVGSVVGQDRGADSARPGSGAQGAGSADRSPAGDGSAKRVTARRTGPPATVTGIRHWSTPSYTRVAIDLGGEVEYEAARVPGPDRIYFDLHGARLAQELVGKSFTVTDDGFLKKIRVAQSSGDMARIVLDVNDVTEYSAFLLPNPYRLIIDIHGAVKPAAAPMASMDAPAKPAASVPNTRAVNAGSGTEVARLSDQPGRVEATSVPTSEPISAVVKAREGGAAREQGIGNGEQLAGKREQGTGNREQRAGGRGQVGEVARADGGGADSPVRGSEGRVGAGGGAATGAEGRAVDGRAGEGRTGVGSSGGRRTRDAGLEEVRPGEGRSRRGKRLQSADGRVVGDPGTPARAAVPTADGQTSLVRALGLKIGRIVIDAGHGGHDSGTLGVDGLEEKDVVLDVALRLGKLLRERMGAEVIYTRSDDTFVPLETRTAIANKAQADLFLSIHANSSADASARGVETYYLNFTQQADALAVAARENAVSNQSIYQLSDLVKKIALKEKIAESREFATDVEAGLYGGLQKGNDGLKNRGVKKAPFVVLIGANMPSILAEISFVTNPKDATQLRDPEYRQRVAESLYKGVERYAGGLSGMRAVATVAERGGHR